MRRNLFFQTSIVVLLFVLTYTASSKWLNFSHFNRAMRSQPIPEPIAEVLTYLIPIAEIIAVIAILLPALRQRGLLLTAVFMTAFTGYVLYIKLAGFDSNTCPCGGLFANLSWNQHLIVNILLTILSYWTLYINIVQQRIPGHGKRGNADASDQPSRRNKK